VRTTYRDNISGGGLYGAIGDNFGPGTSSINKYMPGGNFTANVLVLTFGPNGFPAGSFYPASGSAVGFANLAAFDFHLAASSPYKGKATDGKDPGADIDAVNQTTATAIVP
jgi:hypothetical protein